MSIIWKYLDKRSATVEAIKDYSSMQFIIEHTDEKIKEEQNKMVSLGSPRYNGMPHSHNPRAAEDRIIGGIEEIDVLKERYRQAVEYMEWFQPSWDQLTPDEFYTEGYEDTNVVYAIRDKYNIERSSAYNKKNRALQHLQVLLFGKA